MAAQGWASTLAQSLVKQHGGTIECTANLAARISRILLPLDGRPPRLATSPPWQIHPPGVDRRAPNRHEQGGVPIGAIWVVDDDPDPDSCWNALARATWPVRSFTCADGCDALSWTSPRCWSRTSVCRVTAASSCCKKCAATIQPCLAFQRRRSLTWTARSRLSRLARSNTWPLLRHQQGRRADRPGRGRADRSSAPAAEAPRRPNCWDRRGDAGSLPRHRPLVAKPGDGADHGRVGLPGRLVARALHQHSARAIRPFVAINTAAIPKDLLESELFGHERGAFTGAQAQRRAASSRPRAARCSSMKSATCRSELQTRLLRVLSDGQFYRVGGHEAVKSQVRVIAATHQDLEARVRQTRPVPGRPLPPPERHPPALAAAARARAGHPVAGPAFPAAQRRLPWGRAQAPPARPRASWAASPSPATCASWKTSATG